MRGLLVVLVVIVALGGVGAWLATQPEAPVASVQPSDNAARAAVVKVFAAFKAAELKAVLTRRAQPVSVELSDEELTSLADARLASGDTAFHDAVLHGSGSGEFQAESDADWNGVTLHVYAAGGVSFGADGSADPQLAEVRVGRLPVPGPIVQALLAEARSSLTVRFPPGISGVALRPVEGGAVLTATAAPDAAALLTP